MRTESILGVVLAGGRSTRMGGGLKALVPLGGKPMVAHVIARFAAQVSDVHLSVAQPESGLEPFGLAQLQDNQRYHQGPLAGLVRALQFARRHAFTWVVVVPCDGPFLPEDLVSRLIETAATEDVNVAAAIEGNQPHPTFSAWHRSEYEFARAALRSGRRGLLTLIRSRPHAWVRFDHPPSPFENVNTPADLAAAEVRMAAESTPC